MRFLIIGPSHPFRGGIAAYSTLLYDALRKDYPLRRQQPLVPLRPVEEPLSMSSVPQRFPPEPRFKT